MDLIKGNKVSIEIYSFEVRGEADDIRYIAVATFEGNCVMKTNIANPYYYYDEFCKFVNTQFIMDIRTSIFLNVKMDYVKEFILETFKPNLIDTINIWI